jgi:triacylglycerol esterase/lipase EstA (alpha/beta hydrolase family)
MQFHPLVIVSRLLLAAAWLAAFAAQAQPSDYAREKRWAAEIVPALVVGEAVRLQAAKHEFLGLYTAAKNAKIAIVLAHGLGIHPDYGLIGSLRARLADAGYATLSIQMPILAADAPAARYAALFPEADARFAAAVEFLRKKGLRRFALVSHSMGSRMANHYLYYDPKARFSAWVAISVSSGKFEPLGKLKLPVYDVYAEHDLEPVVQGAAERAKVLRRIRGSSQTMVFGTDHFFAKKEKELATLISLLLEGEKK